MPPPPPGYSLAEIELAHRARDGDGDALATLYERYRDGLYRHAWRMLRDEAGARDVVQEAFARAITAMPRTRDEQLLFRAWIYRIVTNLCLRELTQRSRGSDVDPEEVGEAGDNPERAMRRTEAGWIAERALARLPEQYRQILLLREVEGLEYEELAQVLELSLSMVKVTLHRARARFQALVLGEQLQGTAVPEVACEELGRLLRRGERRAVERHLESCRRCREERPSPGVLALLPPVPAAGLPDAPPALPRSPTDDGAGAPDPLLAPPALVGAPAPVGLSMVLWVLGLAVAIILAVTIGRLVSRRAGTAAVAARRPAQASPSPASRPARPAVVAGAASRGEASASRPARSQSAGSTASGGAQTKHAHHAFNAKQAAASRPSRTTDAGVPVVARPQVLRVKLELRPHTVTVERGGSSFPLAPEHRLLLHDVLATAPGAHVALRLPKGQWLALGGRLKLLDGPTDKDPTDKISDRVIVVLLSGAVRAKATAEGNGVVVRAGARSCRGDGGEFRVRHTAQGLRVEALSSYVVVRGPHATRTVPEGSGIILGEEPGFPQVLLPAPGGLRPIVHRAPTPPLLTWDRVAGATSYRIVLGNDPLFWIPEETTVVRTTSYRPHASPGKHYWMVLAQRGELQGAPSKVFAFVVSPPSPR